jgi:hypothetical protein
VPDLEVGPVDRRARPGVLDGEDEVETQARPALADVATRQVRVDPVRALGDLGRQDAACRLRVVGPAERAEPVRAEQAAEAQAARGEDRLAAPDAGR